MPWYLDRHDAPGLTPEELAAAHMKDLEVQQRFGVVYHSYWFDETNGAVFCLAEGPSEQAVVDVHQTAHGELPSAVIEIDELQPLNSYMGGVPRHPPGDAYTAPALRAIVFTDICNSVAQIHELGDDAHLEVLQKHNEIVRGALDEHDGREVKHTGDGIMASFTSIASSVSGAVDMQRRFDEHNAGASVPLSVKIGISAGEPVTDDNNDLFGAAVSLAARLCDHADAGEILTTVGVREFCMGKKLRFEQRGELALKGMPEPMLAYRVLWQA